MFYKKMLKQLGLTIGITALSLSPIYASEIISTEEPTLLAEETTAVSSPFKFDHLDYNPDLYAYRVSFSVRFDSSKAGCITNISNAGKELVLEEEYNTSDRYLELNTSYLNHQNLGELVLEVTFESGETYNLYINVVPSLKLDLENTTPAISNTIGTNFNFTVSDNASYDLSKLKVRYYYTADGMQGENATVDNVSITYNQAPWYQSITNNVKAQIIPMKVSTNLADTYLELSFTGNEVLDQSAKLTLNTRINKSDWSNYDQSNDCSYPPTRNVCVYYDDQLIIGDDPVTSECCPN